MAAPPDTGVVGRHTRLPGHGDLPLPAYATRESAGADIHAAVEEPVRLEPGERALIPTGFRMALPHGYEAQIRPRSGKALREGLSLLNSPGTVDADYRGEVRILVINHGEIIEQGTHHELLDKKGFYHNLYMSQFKGQHQAVPEIAA